MSSPEPQKSGPYLGPRGVRSEDAATCRRWKQDVSSQSGLVSPYAHQISRRSVNIPPHPHNMNTPHASYPIDRSCSSLKCKRAAPNSLSTGLKVSRLKSSVASSPMMKVLIRYGGST